MHRPASLSWGMLPLLPLLPLLFAGLATRGQADLDMDGRAPVKPMASLREAKDGSLVLVIEATSSQPTGSQMFVDSRGHARGILALRRDTLGAVRPMGTQAVRLLSAGQEVDRALTDPLGRFTLRTRGPGKYEIRFHVDTSLVETRAEEEQDGLIWASDIRSLARPTDRLAPPAERPSIGPPLPAHTRSPDASVGPGLKPNALDGESRIGTVSNGNDDVQLDSHGRFLHRSRQNERHQAANDEVFLGVDSGFRGIVTGILTNLKRAPLAGAEVLLVREGQLYHRTLSGGNGSFAFHGVTPGSYTVIARAQLTGSDVGRRPLHPDFPGSIALQRIIVRPFEAILEPRTVFEEAAASPNRVQVAFESPISPLPVLHLSPAPAEDVARLLAEVAGSSADWSPTAPTASGLGGLGRMLGASVEPGLDIRAARSLLLPASKP